MKPYRYWPLKTGKGRIRLVVLSPKSSPDLYLRIFQVTLRPDDPAPYEALSYVWGKPKPAELCEVRVRIEARIGSKGVGITRSIRITPNLLEALQHLRFEHEPRRLWIDSICINQADHEERGRAIREMTKIYACASRVIAYLGPSNRHVVYAFELCQAIGQSIDVDWRTLIITRRDVPVQPTKGDEFDEWLLDPHSAMPPWSAEATAIWELFDRPWFERLWVRQEIFLGQSNALLQCGGFWILWGDFCRAGFLITRKLVPKAKSERDRRRRLILDVIGKRNLCLNGLLNGTRITKCAEPRDRIYGILGMLQGKDQCVASQISPNYRKPVEVVFREAMSAQMKATGRIDLLIDSGLAKWIPTWVPDWSVEDCSTYKVLFQRADAYATVSAKRISHTTLRLDGVWVDSIIESRPYPMFDFPTFDEPEFDTKYQKIRSDLRGLLYGIDLEKLCTSGQSLLEAFCFSLAGGTLVETACHELIHTCRTSLTQLRTALQHLLSDLPLTRDDYHIYSHLHHAKKDSGSALLITQSGRIGLGPAASLPGDCVAVLLGCCSPMILHPSNGTTFTVKGPAYVHSLEMGQALLGPLPCDVRYKWTWDANGFETLYFESHGERERLDPRIEWDELEIDREEDALVSVADGKGGLRHYRRPDSEYFRACGVMFETFELV